MLNATVELTCTSEARVREDCCFPLNGLDGMLQGFGGWFTNNKTKMTTLAFVSIALG